MPFGKHLVSPRKAPGTEQDSRAAVVGHVDAKAKVGREEEGEEREATGGGVGVGVGDERVVEVGREEKMKEEVEQVAAEPATQENVGVVTTKGDEGGGVEGREQGREGEGGGVGGREQGKEGEERATVGEKVHPEQEEVRKGHLGVFFCDTLVCMVGTEDFRCVLLQNTCAVGEMSVCVR